MSTQDDDLEDLGRLASGRSLDEGKGGRKRGQPVMRHQANAPTESLDDIVSGLSQDRSALLSSPVTQQSGKAPDPVESLEQLLSTRSAEPQHTQRRAPAVASADSDSLECLVFSGVTSKTAASQQTPQTEDVAQKAIDLPSDSLETWQSAPAQKRSLPRLPLQLRWIVLAVLLALGTAFTIYQQQSDSVSSSSPLAGQVKQLALAVDAYYQKNQRMPESLSELQGFPKDAVEWPMENYGVLLLEPRNEFFFDGESSHDYLIIARQGEEAWAFAKGQKPELQQVPAR